LQNKCQKCNLFSIEIINYNNCWKLHALFDENNFILKSLVGISGFHEVETGSFWENGYFFRQIM